MRRNFTTCSVVRECLHATIPIQTIQCSAPVAHKVITWPPKTRRGYFDYSANSYTPMFAVQNRMPSALCIVLLSRAFRWHKSQMLLLDMVPLVYYYQAVQAVVLLPGTTHLSFSIDSSLSSSGCYFFLLARRYSRKWRVENGIKRRMRFKLWFIPTGEWGKIERGAWNLF